MNYELGIMNRGRRFSFIIFLSIILASLFMIPVGRAAVFVVGSEQKIISVNENVKIVVGVDTETERLNLFNVELDIPQEFDFVSLNKESSIINIWVKEPVFDAKTRKVSFIGGIPGGFVGRAGLVNVVLKPTKPGDYILSVDSNSEAYLNDGLGTRVVVNLKGMDLNVRGMVFALKVLIFIGLGFIALGIIIWVSKKKIRH